MNEKSRIEKVKAVIQAILTSYPNGITIKKLCADYLEYEGSPIPYSEFGFSTMTKFIKSEFVADILLHDQKSLFGQLCIYSRFSERSAHIRKLVQEQRPNKHAQPCNERNRNVPNGNSLILPLQPPEPIEAIFIRRYLEQIHCSSPIKEHFGPAKMPSFANNVKNINECSMEIFTRNDDKCSRIATKPDSSDAPKTYRQKLLEKLGENSNHSHIENKTIETPHKSNDILLKQSNVNLFKINISNADKAMEQYPSIEIPSESENFLNFHIVGISDISKSMKFSIQFKKNKDKLINLMKIIQ